MESDSTTSGRSGGCCAAVRPLAAWATLVLMSGLVLAFGVSRAEADVEDSCANGLARLLSPLRRTESTGVAVFVSTTTDCSGCNAQAVNMLIRGIRAASEEITPVVLIGTENPGEGRSLRRIYPLATVLEAPLDSLRAIVGTRGGRLDLFVLDGRLQTVGVIRDVHHAASRYDELRGFLARAALPVVVPRIRLRETDDELIVSGVTPHLARGHLAFVDDQRNEFLWYDTSGAKLGAWGPDSVVDFLYRPDGDTLWGYVRGMSGSLTSLQGVIAYDGRDAQLLAYIKTRVGYEWSPVTKDTVIGVASGYGVIHLRDGEFVGMDSLPPLNTGAMMPEACVLGDRVVYPLSPFLGMERNGRFPRAASVSRGTTSIRSELPDSLAAALVSLDSMRLGRAYTAAVNDSTLVLCDAANRIIFLGTARTDGIEWHAVPMTGIAVAPAGFPMCKARSRTSVLGVDGGRGLFRIAIAIPSASGVAVVIQEYSAEGELVVETSFGELGVAKPSSLSFCRTRCDGNWLLVKSPAERWGLMAAHQPERVRVSGDE